MPNRDSQSAGSRSPVTRSEGRSNRWRSRITWLLAVLILVPSLLGFGTKFIEFINTFRHEPGGIFAITPMINYILASLGFLCLLVWAAANGMFHDVERAKHVMLEQQQALDSNRLSDLAADLARHKTRLEKTHGGF